jgi:5-methylthioribose kinase
MAESDETIVSISKPGDGNMVCIANKAGALFIIKQSRGYVETLLKFWLLQIAYY